MLKFWIKFTDGSSGCCEGSNASDAKRIAEHVSGKKVAKSSDAISSLPYPAHPIIWQFNHPVYGACPAFCFQPKKCVGLSSCPRDKACDD